MKKNTPCSNYHMTSISMIELFNMVFSVQLYMLPIMKDITRHVLFVASSNLLHLCLKLIDVALKIINFGISNLRY